MPTRFSGILSCEACSNDAEIPFDYVLDWVTGLDPAVTDYVLSEPAKCPKCRADVTEKTLIEIDPGDRLRSKGFVSLLDANVVPMKPGPLKKRSA